MTEFTYTFDTPTYKGFSRLNTGLFINGTFVQPVGATSTIDIVNPANGKLITTVYAGSAIDVDIAVNAAHKAFKTTWGLKTPGTERGRLLHKLADLVESNLPEFAALEALNVGKGFPVASKEIEMVISTIRYFAGWADKVQGKTIETHKAKLAYTRHEPYGVVGAITPWNYPLATVANKLAAAVATGNTIVIKPSEITPLTALKFASLINQAGFPPGVINIVNGYGLTVGAAIAEHPLIPKVSFTGSTRIGRSIMRAASETNLKSVTLELGGKSPCIIFDDADVDQAVKWAAFGIFFNSGQSCIAGSRIFVQDGIYDKVVKQFSSLANGLASATGDPFTPGIQHGPVVSQVQFERVMSYIESGKSDGANVLVGGQRHGSEGFFVEPTIFTDVKQDMRIVKEEIFGPVAVLIKFTTEEEVIEAANKTSYGLSCNVFSESISRALRVAHALEAGSAFINSALTTEISVPFGGYKQSGIGREMGDVALETYTQIKGVHVNLGVRL